jgi:hypothetical protein
VNLANWHALIPILDDGGDGWTADISKKYFRLGGGPAYSWRLIFQASELSEQYVAILAAIVGAPPAARGELQEFPLTGARADRNELVNRKGAMPVKG